MTRAHLLILAAFLLPPCSLPAAAQSFQPKTIQFKGDSEHTDAELLAAAGLKKGAVLTSEDMNAHTKLLMDTGLFDAINYNFNGQDLILQITPSTALQTVRLENFPFPAGKELNERLHAKLPLFHGKVPEEGTMLSAVKRALEEELAAKGISSATVISTPTDTGSVMNFAITLPLIRVGEIQLEGADDDASGKARLTAAQSTGSAYSIQGTPSQLERALDNYYQEQGYLQATTHAEALPNPVVTADQVQVPFKVKIDHGQQFKLLRLELSPGLLVTQAAFDKQSGLHLGDIVLPDKLRAEWLYIQRQYHNQGYMRAHVIPTATYDPGKATVSYLVTAESGAIYTMGDLNVSTANAEIKNAVLSAWKMPKGAVFNEGAVTSITAVPSLSKLFAVANLNYSLRLHDDTHTVDLTLQFMRKTE